MVGRKKPKPAAAPAPSLTVHQVVAYNFAVARAEVGWTQVETSDRLEPFLGYKLNQAGVSAIEKTFDSERRRNIDAAEIVAFARCFERPIGWFFLPPTDHGADRLEPGVDETEGREDLLVSELVALVVGTPAGWESLAQRLADLLDTDHDSVWNALIYALRGVRDEAGWEQQINLRRRAIQQVTLARLAGPEDHAITRLAAVLVQLVRLTPLGYQKLRDTDPEAALAMLAEGDDLVDELTKLAEHRRMSGERGAGGFDDLRPIDPAEALGPRTGDE